MACASRSLLYSTRVNSHVRLSPPPTASQPLVFFGCDNVSFPKLSELSCFHRYSPAAVKASPGSDGVLPADDGVSLGTMKLPSDTDLQRFESLLFQWANSLCQGANLPLPVPLKVDKIAGGARLGFITIGDGKTEVLVYIDCLVFPATDSSGPIFRAIRNGASKDQPPPGEPRIMRSLLQALQKSVEIARL
ncbi:hypothetical protein L484_019163 [Morus notabilis]|uniref:DUF7148 domain-containing protein n=1 Tax=Morus notabilis TaxID=981085 RepID=W9RGR8_9ROSA|nr:uncharacterized protein LOC21402114 [Morus notabilis]EXB54593.1 hypothetical protein L484_019163 [Morus notabilis]